MKAYQNLVIATICFGIILFHFIVNNEIILIPYMRALMFTLFAVGGYHGGLGIGKVIKESRDGE